MARKPEDVLRDDIRALTGYHVPNASGMVKLDAMENPHRLPEDVRGRIGTLVGAAEINRYPDSGAERLKAKLRATLGIPESAALVLGNGSDEIIQMLMLATARPGAAVLTVDPAFVMFRLIATYCRVGYESVTLKSDFSLDVERMLAVMKERPPAIVFLAYPNNPTGNLFDDDAIDTIVRAAPGLVVIDEAYHAFAGRTWLDRVGRYENLLVMRTLSKLGLAGLRLGMLIGPKTWLEHIDKVRLPYNVGVLSQLVADEALEHYALLEEQAAAIRAERARVTEELARMPGVTPFPSDANFMLFRTGAADRVFAGIKSRGVLVKNVNGTHPLLEGCIRTTVSTPAENDLFLAAVRASLA
jgi:histidinol-phosphate aminotransferase